MRYVMVLVSLVAVAVAVAGCGGAGVPGDVSAPATAEVGEKYAAFLHDYEFTGARTGTRLTGNFQGRVDFMTADGAWHSMEVGNALKRRGDRLSCRWRGGGDCLSFAAHMGRDACQALYHGPGGVRAGLVDWPGVEF